MADHADHRPEAALFDMDGLLLDTERLARAAFLGAVAAVGVPQARAAAFFLTLVGQSSRVNRAQLAAFLPGTDVAPVWADWEARLDRLVEGGVPLRPGVGACLQTLAAAGVRMAVVTSTYGDRARHHLKIAGIAHHFERVTGGDEVGANKPDPAPYVETAHAMGLDPRRCAAFEDSDRGIAAAVAAGCRAVQVPDLRPPTPLPELGQQAAGTLAEALRLVDLPAPEGQGC